ncbi:YhcN/YlaJ family sporulation lipoprotein [Pelotomaculum propionicicum]|uniref:Lipoprotein YhcN n=1 Tax=Pelotomaculum propionicicum TaxID=258475 RepID=A0A4Y7RL55_9FIRM|nr:YhcN/YlaJ family sporulation lipoprotein [Pelotomaculum propionicicum]NLI14479.1 YhcN/YlaJ family sporulation lipoprotein [Peptococcaceae bacterium]TEB09556.1 Lipoprotein YhcN [Pelotomaculum propionicicum]
MKRIKLLPVLILVLAVGMTLPAGCGAARKPVPQNQANDIYQAPAPAPEPMPTSPVEVSKISSDLSGAAARVAGVNSATVVITGTTAYVGIDQKAGLEKSETDRIKREVTDAVKNAEPRVTAVFVSSDPDIVARLRRIAGGVAAGQPVSSFAGELTEIARRLAPSNM